jgi:hypothetical protein
LPHTDHGVIFGETVFHGGDDLIGKRDLRIYRRSFLAVPLIWLPGNGGVRSFAGSTAVSSRDIEARQTRADVMKRRRRSHSKRNRQRLAARAG